MKIEIRRNASELAAHEKILLAMARIEEETGISTRAHVDDLPYFLSHWLPDVSLLLQLFAQKRTDLAIEHVIVGHYERSDQDKVFASFIWKIARNRIEALTRLESKQSEVAAGRQVRSDFTLSGGLIAVCGERVIWVDMETSYGEASCSQTANIEMGLFDTPYLRYSRLQHQHVLFCEQCRIAAPISAHLFDEISGAIFAVTRARLEALYRCLDISDVRCRRLAESAFNADNVSVEEQTDFARHLLAWRGITLAEYMRLDMGVFFPSRVPVDQESDQWIRLLKGEGHPSAIAFVRRLDGELLEAAFMSLVTGQAFTDIWFDNDFNDSLFRVPSDGDLAPFAWTIDVYETTDLSKWELALNESPRGVYVPGLVKLLKNAALVELGRTAKPSSRTALTEDIQQRFDKLESMLDNGHALQMPILELLEKLVHQGSKPSRESAAASLTKHLGDAVFNALVPRARECLIGAEWGFMHAELPNPQGVLREIALAFEVQLMETVYPLLNSNMAKPKASGSANEQHPRPGLPSPYPQREGGPFFFIERALEDPTLECTTLLSSCGFDPTRVFNAVKSVRHIRNHIVHGRRTSNFEDVREQREIWYGMRPGSKSIFSAVVAGSA